MIAHWNNHYVIDFFDTEKSVGELFSKVSPNCLQIFGELSRKIVCVWNIKIYKNIERKEEISRNEQ